jgi:DNA repair exonuclease SbcCD nuclease subunit
LASEAPIRLDGPNANGRPVVAQAAILHVADCHLGSTDLHGEEEAAFERVVDLALSERVDALLIAGDLFDSARVSRELVEWTAAQLDRLECDAVILPGNHDALTPGSPYERHRLDAMAPRVRVLTALEGETVSVAGGKIVVWGRPVVDHAPSFLPLAGVPPRPHATFAIVMAHGLVVEEPETVRGSPIPRAELDALDWDYAALGHWPRYRQITESPPAVYAGELDAVIARLYGTSVTVERRALGK